MRLIDADLLLEELNSFSMKITGSANAMALMVMGETKKSIAKMVDNQPTAYDVDEKVKQMEEKVKSYRDPASSDPGFRKYCNGIATGFRYAIDIVTGGDKSE